VAGITGIRTRKLVDSTKTHKIHQIPCHKEFAPTAKEQLKREGEFLFQNERSRKDHKRYSDESLNVIWKKACQEVGEDIDLYSGLKHSSCSQYLNEKGLGFSELQIITDHANIESVKRYGKVEMDRKRQLLEIQRTGPKLVQPPKDSKNSN